MNRRDAGDIGSAGLVLGSRVNKKHRVPFQHRVMFSRRLIVRQRGVRAHCGNRAEGFAHIATALCSFIMQAADHIHFSHRGT